MIKLQKMSIAGSSSPRLVNELTQIVKPRQGSAAVAQKLFGFAKVSGAKPKVRNTVK